MNRKTNGNLARLSRAALALLGAACLASCASAPQLSRTPYVLAETAADPFVWFFQDSPSNTVDLIYVTDRNVNRGEDGKIHYGHSRSKSLAFGRCSVEIGKRVPWQKFMEQSAALRRSISLPLALQSVEELGRLPETPLALVSTPEGPRDDPAATKLQACMADYFVSEISARLAKSERKRALVFVHGYNNTFADAAFTLAQIWHFLGRGGVPIVYTWPAGIGGVRGYTYDRESGEFTNFHIKQFLRALSATPELEGVDIICHSRGTDVVTTALRELFIEARAAGADPRARHKIDNLILAAPDMDLDVVTQRMMAERLPLGIGRVTMYSSPYDRALGLSGWMFEGVQRLGRIGTADLSPTMLRNLEYSHGVDLIQVSARSGYIGHAYFYSNPSVSSDLILLLREGRAPGAANGRPLRALAPNFWELREGYPNKQSE